MRHTPLLLASLSLLMLQALSAQQATYTLFGTDCTTGRISAGLGPVPIAATGRPRLGGTFSVVTESTASYPHGNWRQVFLLTGASNTTAASGMPLPFDIAGILPGEPTCGLLYTSAEVVTPVPPQISYLTSSSVVIAVPASVTLLGLLFYQQVVSVERTTFGPPFRGLALSRGGRGRVGF